MSEQAKPGRFFPLDFGMVRQIVHQGGAVEEVMAYIITAAHTQGRGANPHRLSSSGVKAVYKYGGIPIRRAQKAMKWLAEKRFLYSADEARKEYGEQAVPQQMGRSLRKPMYWVDGKQDEVEKSINLPHALIYGVKEDSNLYPMKRLYAEIETAADKGVVTSQARLDAVMLLINLYQHHRLDECGGIDPRGGLYRQWNIAADDDGALMELDLPAIMDIDGTNAAVFEVRGGSMLTYTTFAAQALDYVPRDDLLERFWCAIGNLQHEGLMYETVAVWNGDPNKKNNSEPLYTLYIRDKWARENNEPYLQKVVHNVSDSLMGFEVQRLWQDEWSSPGLIQLVNEHGGGFRFIANKRAGGHPIGIYRLRYRPHDDETGLGFKREASRVAEWTAILKKLTMN